ncbi:MAG: muconolactone Delta-isomerase family protein [Cyanobacteria bacterium P01_G01_bin.54]
MNILIVHAHHEPQSFSSALAQQAEISLKTAGHTVVVSDLYAMGFDPVSDRRNFTSTSNADYLKQQREEKHATEVQGFAPDLEAEMQKLEAADALIFNFPLWWFGMPAILKGWCDRVLAMGRVYGGSKLYETGIGNSQKRGLILLTTGGGPSAYDGWGINPSLDAILTPIQHGIFWFNGILPLDPFVAWAPAHLTPEERSAYLSQLDQRLQGMFTEAPIQLPKLADFPNFGSDTQQRYVVTVERKRQPDADYDAKVAAEKAMLAQWQRRGILLNLQMAAPEEPNWRGFLTIRAQDQGAVRSLLGQLPLADYLTFEVTTLSKV